MTDNLCYCLLTWCKDIVIQFLPSKRFKMHICRAGKSKKFSGGHTPQPLGPAQILDLGNSKTLCMALHTHWKKHSYRLSTTQTHMCIKPHAKWEKTVHIERHEQRQTCRLIHLRVSSIIQHSAHRHRLKEGIKHARGPHLEITRTLPVFKMQCSEVKIDLGWFSPLSFF